VLFAFLSLIAHYSLHAITVTDKGKKECVDPEGNGVTMNEGEKRGSARLAGSEISSQLTAVEAARRLWGS
jgi:hypothetical protein